MRARVVTRLYRGSSLPESWHCKRSEVRYSPGQQLFGAHLPGLGVDMGSQVAAGRIKPQPSIARKRLGYPAGFGPFSRLSGPREPDCSSNSELSLPPGQTCPVAAHHDPIPEASSGLPSSLDSGPHDECVSGRYMSLLLRRWSNLRQYRVHSLIPLALDVFSRLSRLIPV